jgi:uncharacterized protein
MPDISARRDLSNFEVPVDAWTKPFWDATARHELLFPQCADCGHYRWPPGPFCPACRSQRTAWKEAGQGIVYSFTIIHDKDPAQSFVPALIEFPQAGGVRLVASIVDTALDAIQIGAKVKPGWVYAGDVAMPVFTI